MSKDITIKKNGITQSLSGVAKITTSLTGGGTQNWIPEDEAENYLTLDEKEIDMNGTYRAEADGADGYSKVTVAVPSSGNMGTLTAYKNGTYVARDDDYDGYDTVFVSVDQISGDNYEIEDDSGDVYAETEIDGDSYSYGVDTVDGTSSILITDPEDGEKYVVTVGEDGTVTKKLYPSSIKVTTPPTKTSYTEGEAISFSGIVCTLYDAAGNVFTDSRYPNGTIDLFSNELLFPVYIAPEGSGEGERSTEDDITVGYVVGNSATVRAGEDMFETYSAVSGSGPFYAYGIGQTGGSEHYTGVYVASPNPFSGQLAGRGYSQAISPSTRTKNDQAAYYIGRLAYQDSFNPTVEGVPVTEIEEGIHMGDVAHAVCYGTKHSGGTAEIPVQWPSSNKALEVYQHFGLKGHYNDSFEIEVTNT